MASTTDVSGSNAGNETSDKGKIIKIQSNDGEIFEIDQGVVEQSSTIKTLSDCEYLMMNDRATYTFDYSNGCGRRCYSTSER
jgi:hypothetical protein